MSVENEARPQGPSKVSRRNLIAGAAIAVPAAAVLNASSAWAKPVVNSLIGMPALVASVNYQYDDLFTGTIGTISRVKKTIKVGFTLKNKADDVITGISVTATASRTGSNPLEVTGESTGFSLGPGSSEPMTLTIGWAGTPNPDMPAGSYVLTISVTATVAGVVRTIGKVYGLPVD